MHDNSEAYALIIPASYFKGDFNRTLYGHFFMLRHGYTIYDDIINHGDGHGDKQGQRQRQGDDDDDDTSRRETNVVYVIRALTKIMPHTANVTRNLLDEQTTGTNHTTTNINNNNSNTNGASSSSLSLLPKRVPRIAHWKSQMPLQVVNDYNRYPFGKLPADFAKLYQFDKYYHTIVPYHTICHRHMHHIISYVLHD